MTGEIKPFGLVLGLMGNVLIALAMHTLLMGASCTANLDTVQQCTSSIGPGAAMLPIGIIVSTAAIFAGGGRFALLGTFLAVGVGSMWAGFQAHDDFVPKFAKLFGGIFIAVPLLLGLASGGLSRGGKRSAARAQNLMATGAPATGTITSVSDTGMTINDNPRVNITMRIEPEDRSPAFDAVKTVTVSRVAIPRAGDRYAVWYDRNDPSQWAYGTTTTSISGPASLQSMMAPAPAAAPVTDTSTELTRLNDLRMKGVLTDAEFEAAKARLLGTAV